MVRIIQLLTWLSPQLINVSHKLVLRGVAYELLLSRIKVSVHLNLNKRNRMIYHLFKRNSLAQINYRRDGQLNLLTFFMHRVCLLIVSLLQFQLHLPLAESHV